MKPLVTELNKHYNANMHIIKYSGGMKLNFYLYNLLIQRGSLSLFLLDLALCRIHILRHISYEKNTRYMYWECMPQLRIWNRGLARKRCYRKIKQSWQKKTAQKGYLGGRKNKMINMNNFLFHLFIWCYCHSIIFFGGLC